jgi:hypothetical protein
MLETVHSIRNPGTRHAVVKGGPTNMAIRNPTGTNLMWIPRSYIPHVVTISAEGASYETTRTEEIVLFFTNH